MTRADALAAVVILGGTYAAVLTILAVGWPAAVLALVAVLAAVHYAPAD